ncbi:MAG TPA: hypothetical protein VKZ18_01655 [Polyangia bacterium]|nr:hypothetical protein [Polyangia bacterium]
MKPSARDIAILLALQMGISAVMAVLLALLPFDAGSGSWVAGVGIIVGSQSFVQLSVKRYPDGFGPGYAHRLGLAAAVGQLVIGGLAAAAVVVGDASVVAKLGISPAAFVLIIVAVAGPLAYGLTRWGFRIGERAAARMRAAAGRRAEKATPDPRA